MLCLGAMGLFHFGGLLRSHGSLTITVTWLCRVNDINPQGAGSKMCIGLGVVFPWFVFFFPCLSVDPWDFKGKTLLRGKLVRF